MGIVDEFFQGFQQLIDNNVAEAFHNLAVYFDTPFFHMIGYTAIAAVGSAALGYFFDNLKPFAGAVFFGLGSMWYGFYQGKHGEDK